MSDYWKDNNIVKPQQKIVCAACYDGEILICGARHWDPIMNRIFSTIKAAGNQDLKSSAFEQGFIDQFGKFVGRVEAYKIVQENGQPFDKERNGDDVELYSEGLY